LFAQTDRPGHFAVVETWGDQAAFDARDAAAKRELMESLALIRVSDYDERPYKPLTLAPAKTGAEARNVFVIAHVDVAPNTQAPMLLQQVAAASRQEPGNLRFDVLQHAMRGNHFTIIEQWRNQDALDAHVATVHARAYRDALQRRSRAETAQAPHEAHRSRSSDRSGGCLTLFDRPASTCGRGAQYGRAGGTAARANSSCCKS
jgi:quinol monooxygenase YgiN